MATFWVDSWGRAKVPGTPDGAVVNRFYIPPRHLRFLGEAVKARLKNFGTAVAS
jgi:hypothetical protein